MYKIMTGIAALTLLAATALPLPASAAEADDLPDHPPVTVT